MRELEGCEGVRGVASGETGETYRLPSESEWEYAARAGSTTTYSWGNEIGDNRANCDGCGSRWDDRRTAPAGSFAPNGFGLKDMHGNVNESVEDCWNGSYKEAPSDGGAWESGDCALRVSRGGSWNSYPRDLRAANRIRNSHRRPQLQPRVPCGPDAHPLSLYIFGGSKGACPLGRNFSPTLVVALLGGA